MKITRRCTWLCRQGFLSLEPLLEDLGTLDLAGISWCIVGGESGPGARPCNLAWIRSIVEQCKAANVPVFVKQLGSHPVQAAQPDPVLAAIGSVVAGDSARWAVRLADRKGGDPAEWPADLRVRQMPGARP